MTNVTTTPSTPPARPTSPQLSEGLISLLENDGNPDWSVEQIAGSPVLLEEARRTVPALKAVATHRAGEAGVRAVVGKRFALYPQPPRSDGEWAAWWQAYYDVLADIPLASLEAGMRAYVADPESEFMPKPGKLRELAFTAPCRSLLRYQRAERAIRVADERAQRIPGPPADADQVKALLAEFEAKAAAKASAKPALPSIAGKTDAGGLTPEMRALMARRSGAAA